MAKLKTSGIAKPTHLISEFVITNWSIFDSGALRFEANALPLCFPIIVDNFR